MNLEELEAVIPPALRRALIEHFGRLPELPRAVALPKLITEPCSHCRGTGQEPARETFPWRHGFSVGSFAGHFHRMTTPTREKEFYAEHLGEPYEPPARKTEDEITEEMKRDREEIKKRAHADLERRGLLSRKSVPDIAKEIGATYVGPAERPPMLMGMPIVESEALEPDEFLFAPIEALPGVTKKGEHYEVSIGDEHIGKASGVRFEKVTFDAKKYTTSAAFPRELIADVEIEISEEDRDRILKALTDKIETEVAAGLEVEDVESEVEDGMEALKELYRDDALTVNEYRKAMGLPEIGSEKKPIRIKDRLKNFRVGEYAYIGCGIHGSEAWNEAGEFYLVISVSDHVVLIEDRSGKIHEMEPLTLADSAHPDDFEKATDEKS